MQSMCRVARYDSFLVGLATVDDDASGRCISEKAFSLGGRAAVCAGSCRLRHAFSMKRVSGMACTKLAGPTNPLRSR